MSFDHGDNWSPTYTSPPLGTVNMAAIIPHRFNHPMKQATLETNDDPLSGNESQDSQLGTGDNDCWDFASRTSPQILSAGRSASGARSLVSGPYGYPDEQRSPTSFEDLSYPAHLQDSLVSSPQNFVDNSSQNSIYGSQSQHISVYPTSGLRPQAASWSIPRHYESGHVSSAYYAGQTQMTSSSITNMPHHSTFMLTPVEPPQYILPYASSEWDSYLFTPTTVCNPHMPLANMQHDSYSSGAWPHHQRPNYVPLSVNDMTTAQLQSEYPAWPPLLSPVATPAHYDNLGNQMQPDYGFVFDPEDLHLLPNRTTFHEAMPERMLTYSPTSNYSGVSSVLHSSVPKSQAAKVTASSGLRSEPDLFKVPLISPIVFSSVPSPVTTSFSPKSAMSTLDSPIKMKIKQEEDIVLSCYCQNPHDADMVECLGPTHYHPRSFHLGCAGLDTPPSDPSNWYCSDCLYSRKPKNAASTMSSPEAGSIYASSSSSSSTPEPVIKSEFPTEQNKMPITPQNRVQKSKVIILKATPVSKRTTVTKRSKPSTKYKSTSSGSRVGVAKGKAWSPDEEEVCIKLMREIKLSGRCKRIDELWNAVAERMRKDHGSTRSGPAVKNQWNRSLREQSGFDERHTPKPNALRTGLLPISKKSSRST